MVAAVTAGAAAWLAVGPPPAAKAGPVGRSRARLALLGVGGVAAAMAAMAAMAMSGHLAGLAVVAAGVAWGARTLWGRRRRRYRSLRLQAAVLEACELLAAELRAGQPPGAALARAARDFSALEPASRAFRMAGDVPDALRRAAAERGAADLALLAASWQVAQQSGAGLAVTVGRLAVGLRATAATQRLVAAELASARATARLMAGLPVLALSMGSGIGGDPWAFLLTSPAGLVCLALGLGFGFAGLWWIEAIADGVER